MAAVNTPILPSREDVRSACRSTDQPSVDRCSDPHGGDNAYIQATLATVLSQRELWLPQVRYLPDSRWYQRWETTTDGSSFDGEVWLISWPSGASTGLHDHGGSPGAFVTVDGELSEQTISGSSVAHRRSTDGAPAAPRRRTHLHRAGHTRAFDRNHLHNVGNTSKRHALSVHVYAPALTTMTRYVWTPRGPEVVSIDRAGTDW